MNDKICGAMVGAVVGDAIGFPFERKGNQWEETKHLLYSWKRRSGGQYWPYIETHNKGTYSDDTQLILCVARSLRYGKNWREYLGKIELPLWLEYELGGGRATIAAVQCLKKGKYPWAQEECREYFTSTGNGVAMRILPHILASRNITINKLLNEIFYNGILTHGHPRALLGARLYGYYLWMVKNNKFDGINDFKEVMKNFSSSVAIWGEFPINVEDTKDLWLRKGNTYFNNDYKAEWDKWKLYIYNKIQVLSKRDITEGLKVLLEDCGCFDKKISIGDTAALGAIVISIKYQYDVIQGLTSSGRMLGIDTDTITSMAGAALGLMNGTKWITDDVMQIQDYNYIRKIAQELYKPSFIYLDIEACITAEGKRTNKKSLKSLIKKTKIGQKINYKPFGYIEIIDWNHNKTLIPSIKCSVIKALLDGGQTLELVYLEKRSGVDMHNNEPIDKDAILEKFNVEENIIINSSLSRYQKANYIGRTLTKENSLMFWGATPSKTGKITKACLSQWWRCDFYDNGLKFCCTEQYMMYNKAILFKDFDTANKILLLTEPKKIKKLGREVKNFVQSEWDNVKVDIVTRGGMLKFSQDEGLREFLKSTGNKILIEASPKDAVWGIGLSEKDEMSISPHLWKGENLLGFSLMKVRDLIKAIW